MYVFTFGDLDYQDDEPRVIRSPGVPLADTGFYLSLRYKTRHKRLLRPWTLCTSITPSLSGRLAISYCRSENIPIVYTNHTRFDLYAQARMPFMPVEVSNGLLQAYMPDFCSEMDLVISPSRGMEKVLRQYGIQGHIEVVPNGVDLTRFHNAAPLSRSDFGFKDDDILLVYARPYRSRKKSRLPVSGVCGRFPAHPKCPPADRGQRAKGPPGGDHADAG
ncbi:MAG: glycosyltransferase [Candidatus Moduliflexus flocculans]|nr:glycosyltransferase [Candidatus Moduliflexus flocculans]